MVQVSVVVPTVGRSDLSGVLDALAAQDDAPPFEIIVAVDGDSEPDFGGIRLHPHCSRLVLVQLAVPQGVSVARNRAVEQAHGALIGFLDDDTVPKEDWLKRLQVNLSGEHAGVAGRIFEQASESILSRLRALAFAYRNIHNQGLGENPIQVDYMNGGNCGIRAEIFRELGGFDPKFRKSQDRDLARRVVLAGHTITYDPELAITHAGHYTAKGFWRGRFRAGRAAQTMKRLSGAVSVGPTRMRTTYGGGLLKLSFQHGVKLAFAALVALVAHRAGWVTGMLFGPEEGSSKGPDPTGPTPSTVRQVYPVATA
ncbi:glycosyltransferase family 2 protein [Kribbella solani]|uniref:glycosyltransferase family 2 protein n=1 Tax=Kribbella solani TaxID=236067 RepID=UPI0029A76BCC|nr:glycosyltransferase [Kribbella solani]MDX2974521.1 glycosyltransferase [Kribbella solani]